MGSIQIFDLNDFIKPHNCRIYVETGTGVGECLSHAAKYPFERLYTIDLDGELVERAKTIFTDPRIECIHEYSSKALRELVPKLPREESILFFLDAHFPGADFHKISYQESITEFGQEAFPLHQEIQEIKACRDISNDVFIIDDWKLYDADQPYELPGWQYSALQRELGINTSAEAILEELSETHQCVVNTRHQGFLFATPKNIKT